MPGQVENRKRSRSDFFPDDLSDVPPSWLLGGLVVYLTSKAVRAQLRHLNKTTIIIAAHPLPDAEHACTELWCFPGIRRFSASAPARIRSPASSSTCTSRASSWLPRASSMVRSCPRTTSSPPPTSPRCGAASSIPSPSSSRRRSGHDPRFLAAPAFQSPQVHARACRDRPEPGGRMLRRIMGIEVEEHAGGNARRTRTARIQRVGWHRNRRRC